MTELSPAQLPLGIKLNDEARFENYLIAASNQPLTDVLTDASQAAQVVYVRANPGTGLSHLLQALCHQETLTSQPAIYIPLAERDQWSPELLAGVGNVSLVCLDDVDQIAGDEAWERALFTAFNDIVAGTTRLVMGGRKNPGEAGFGLADLQSRLQSALLYQLHGLDDQEKRLLLQLRARGRGMNLSPAVAEYILARTERGLPALMTVLDKLDASTLAHQRPLTIPLVRQTMGW